MLAMLPVVVADVSSVVGFTAATAGATVKILGVVAAVVDVTR